MVEIVESGVRKSWRKSVKQFLCRHTYSDANLTSCTVGESRDILLKNHCLKCGKPFEIRLSGRYLDYQLEKDMEEIRKNGKLKS